MIKKILSLGKTVIIFSYYAFAGYGLIMVITWALDSEPVISLGQGVSSTTEVYPGDTVIFYQPIKKLRDCPGGVSRSLVGECGLFHIQEAKTIPELGDHVVKTSVELPLSVLPGSCTFMSKFTYFCDPLDYVFSGMNYSATPIQFLVRKSL